MNDDNKCFERGQPQFDARSCALGAVFGMVVTILGVSLFLVWLTSGIRPILF